MKSPYTCMQARIHACMYARAHTMSDSLWLLFLASDDVLAAFWIIDYDLVFAPTPRCIDLLQGILLLLCLSLGLRPLALQYVVSGLNYFGQKWWEPGEEESVAKLRLPAGQQAGDSCLLQLHHRAQMFSI